MRVCTLVLFLLASVGSAAAQDSSSEESFYIAAHPSVVEEPLHRERIRLFSFALSAFDVEVEWDESFHQMFSSDEWDWVPDPPAATGFRTVFLFHTGDEPEFPLDPRDEVVALHVGALSSERLVLRACQRAYQTEPVNCRTTDHPPRLAYPGDNFLAVEETESGDFSARVESFAPVGSGSPFRTEVYRGDVEAQSFVVESRVHVPEPQIGQLYVVESLSDENRPVLGLTVDGATGYLVNTGARRFRATLGEHEIFLQANLNTRSRSFPLDPVSVRFPLPAYLPDGTYDLGVELVESSSGEVLAASATTLSLEGDLAAGQFIRWVGFGARALELERGGLDQTHGENSAFFVPWWSQHTGPFAYAPEAGGYVEGASHPDPLFSWFLLSVFLVAWFGGWFVGHRRCATHKAVRVGKRATYREAPGESWTVDPVSSQEVDPEFRVVQTPFGAVGIANRPVWVRHGSWLFSPRWVTFLYPETLVVCQERQYFFLSPENPDSLRPEELVNAIAHGEIDLTQEAKRASRALAFARGLARHLGVALVLCAFALGLAFLLTVDPVFTQRNYFATAAGGFLVIGLIARFLTQKRFQLR